MVPQSVDDEEVRTATAPQDSDGAASDTERPRRGVVPRRASLRAYLVIPAVVFALAAGANVFYQRRAAARDARRSAVADAGFAVRIAARGLDDAIVQVQSQVAATAAEPGLAQVFGAPEDCTLNYATSGTLGSGHIDVVGAEGAVLCTSLKRAGTAPEYAGASWLASARTHSVLLAPVTDARTGRPALVAASPIDARGVLVIFIDLGDVGPAMAKSFGGPRHLEFVVTNAARTVVLSRSIHPLDWVGHPLRRSAFARADAPVARADLDGIDRYYGRSAVPSAHWIVFAGASKSGALAAAIALSNRQLVITLLGLVLFLGAGWFVHRRIARPIADLSASVRDAADDLTAQPIGINGPREVAGLVEEFNQLIGAAQREREVTSLMISLEQRLRRAERVDEQERELRLLEDRERIGRDLHDTVIQQLFATGIALQGAVNRMQAGVAKERVVAAIDDIDVAIRDVRTAIFEVEHGRGPAPTTLFVDLVSDAGESLGFRPTVEFSGPVDAAISPLVVDQMLAALRESMSNVARHASAQHVAVAVTVEDEAIALTVTDDGAGSTKPPPRNVAGSVLPTSALGPNASGASSP